MVLKSFIVRIYRKEKEDPGRIFGIVEEAGRGSRQAFKNAGELWEIVSKGKAGERRYGKQKAKERKEL